MQAHQLRVGVADEQRAARKAAEEAAAALGKCIVDAQKSVGALYHAWQVGARVLVCVHVGVRAHVRASSRWPGTCSRERARLLGCAIAGLHSLGGCVALLLVHALCVHASGSSWLDRCRAHSGDACSVVVVGTHAVSWWWGRMQCGGAPGWH